MTRAFSHWLSPAYDIAPGGRLPGGESPGANKYELRADLDQVEALNPEREALWARLNAAAFLTDDEKRAAAGYAALPSGGTNSKYREDQPRVPAGSGRESGRWTDGGNSESAQLAQASRGRGAYSVRIGEQTFEASPAQIMRLSNATNAADAAIARVREIEPNWRPRPGVSETVEGEISAREREEREAVDRLAELTRDSVPNTNPSWGVNRLRKELNDQGYRFERPTDSEGYLYRNEQGAEVRIMKRPGSRFRLDPLQKHQNEYYYRYRSGPDQPWGQHRTLPDKTGNFFGM